MSKKEGNMDKKIYALQQIIEDLSYEIKVLKEQLAKTTKEPTKKQ